ncbi:MAG: hypothetical protein NTX82_06665 [Candidatus Parcubacteria bacterium]|nr:hypothetical protein [Candidatus Parcubacteria bacterium]
MEVYLLEKEYDTKRWQFCACYLDLNKAIEAGRKLAQEEAQKNFPDYQQIDELNFLELKDCRPILMRWISYWEIRLMAIPVIE